MERTLGTGKPTAGPAEICWLHFLGLFPAFTSWWAHTPTFTRWCPTVRFKGLWAVRLKLLATISPVHFSPLSWKQGEAKLTSEMGKLGWNGSYPDQLWTCTPQLLGLNDPNSWTKVEKSPVKVQGRHLPSVGLVASNQAMFIPNFVSWTGSHSS